MFDSNRVLKRFDTVHSKYDVTELRSSCLDVDDDVAIGSISGSDMIDDTL